MGINGPTIILVGGAAAILYLIVDWMRYRMRRRMRREGTEGGITSRFSLDPKVYVMIIYTMIVAFLYFRPIPRPPSGDELPVDLDGAVLPIPYGQCIPVAIYILIVGIWWAVRQAGKAKVSEKQLVATQVAELVNSFKSVFRIRPTVFSALEEANRKMPPPVGTAVAHAVTTFYVTSLPQRAFSELRQRIQDPYMDQLVYILERGEDARHEDIMNALNDLQLRLRRARELRDQSEVNMTVISGQTRVIQLIAVALITIVGFVPLLRVAYEAPIGQAIFIFIATIGVVTSWYIDRASQALKERVL